MSRLDKIKHMASSKEGGVAAAKENVGKKVWDAWSKKKRKDYLRRHKYPLRNSDMYYDRLPRALKSQVAVSFNRIEESPEVIDARWRKKKDHIRELSNNMGRLRARITRDIDSDDEKRALTALVVAIMEKTGERVGNFASACNGHYGVTGFCKKHVNVTGDGVELDYVGKSGVDHEKEIVDQKIAKALKRAIKNSPKKYVFTTSAGRTINANDINDYLREFNVTAKAIRGYSANRWILDRLKQLAPDDTDKKRKKQFNQVLRDVAKKIGHGASTLRKHYMMPEVSDFWINEGKVFDAKQAGYSLKEGGTLQGGGVVKSSSLYFREGNSDKVYHIQMAKQGDGYVVNVQWGRRGSALQSGTKTPSPVPMQAAEKVYSKVMNEKLGKGYRQSDEQAPRMAAAPARPPKPSDAGAAAFSPQLLNETDDPESYIADDRYLAQEKMDGERRPVISSASGVVGLNKKGREVPLTAQISSSIRNRGIFDAEQVGDTLYVFDLVSVDDRDISGLSTEKRLEELGRLRFGDGVRVVDTAYTERDKRRMFDRIKSENGEGIVFKLKSSPYSAGRPNSGGPQLKHKFNKTATFIVTGITTGKRSARLALIDDHGDRIYMGKVTIPPNKPVPNVGDLVEVRYLYAYKGGAIYQPVYLDVRRDQDLSDATMAQIVYKKDMAKGGDTADDECNPTNLDFLATIRLSQDQQKKILEKELAKLPPEFIKEYKIEQDLSYSIPRSGKNWSVILWKEGMIRISVDSEFKIIREDKINGWSISNSRGMTMLPGASEMSRWITSYARGGASNNTVTFSRKANPSHRIIVHKTPDGRISQVENSKRAHFPFKVGQLMGRNVEVWAANNGWLMDGKDMGPEKKIFGIPVSQIPQGHEWRMIYPNKFREEGGEIGLKYYHWKKDSDFEFFIDATYENRDDAREYMLPERRREFDDEVLDRKGKYELQSYTTERGRQVRNGWVIAENKKEAYELLGENYQKGGSTGMNVEKCERCGEPTEGVTIMSMFNEDIICMKCKEEERKHPDYKKATDAEMESLKRGERNFKGIGYEKKAKGGKMDSYKIIYLNKNKNFQRDVKIFEGKDAYEKAVKWGERNIDNFYADDMIRLVRAEGGMTNEDIISKYNLWGKGIPVKFRNNQETFWTKNISADRRTIFVSNKDGMLRNKNISDIVSIDNKPVRFSDGGEIITSDGTQGGMAEGPAHSDGGIQTDVIGGSQVEIEGGEPIIVPEAMQISEKVRCIGTPKGIASSVNQLGGGASFTQDHEGECKYVEKPKSAKGRRISKFKKPITKISPENGRIKVRAGSSIINKTNMKIEEKMVCEGTPGGVASAINEYGGNGVKFADDGKCRII